MKVTLLLLLLLVSCQSTPYKMPSNKIKVLQFPKTSKLSQKINFTVKASYNTSHGLLKTQAREERRKILQGLAKYGYGIIFRLTSFDFGAVSEGRTLSMNSFWRNDPATSPADLESEIFEGRNGLPAYLNIKKFLNYEKKGRESFFLSRAKKIFSELVINADKSIVKYEWQKKPVGFKGNTFTLKVHEVLRGRDFSQVSALSNTVQSLWRAPDFKKLGGQLVAKYSAIGQAGNNPVIPNLDLVDFFERNVPQITPRQYLSAITTAELDMQKFKVDKILSKTGYNDFSYKKFVSYIYSDDASGDIKFQVPSSRTIRDNDTLKKLWAVILLGHTKTKFTRSEGGKDISIEYELDLQSAVRFAKSKSRSSFYE